MIFPAAEMTKASFQNSRPAKNPQAREEHSDSLWTKAARRSEIASPAPGVIERNLFRPSGAHDRQNGNQMCPHELLRNDLCLSALTADKAEARPTASYSARIRPAHVAAEYPVWEAARPSRMSPSSGSPSSEQTMIVKKQPDKKMPFSPERPSTFFPPQLSSPRRASCRRCHVPNAAGGHDDLPANMITF